ncbi:GNAT family N-acetyltransferase [Malonomonas rubra]|uniref:GNAT family N-acetyltransferase n=1 Tax=Malonomonas rubra TaxID=57040 RepID=UPI0026EB8E22|nr:hypothetical protein [Malonomonas rubra]
MPYQIEFATAADEESLRSIFLASDMALVGDIEDHVVIKDEAGTYGGGLLYQLDVDLFHLLTIVVQNDGRSRGLGSQLLQALLQKPWSYCRDSVVEPAQSYRVTTVSRGVSRSFYQKNGLLDCDFDELTEPFARQCQFCPDQAECSSAAMVYQR